jgi:hypothetical protein
VGKKDRERDDVEPRCPDDWELFRVLSESTDQGRRVTELVDHKARYALVLIGVVNAAVIYLATRSDFRSGATGWMLSLMGILVVIYVGATFGFLWYAIQALRPRRLGGERDPGGGSAVLSGVLYWEEIVRRDLASYRERWNRITMEELNQELIVISHALSLLIQAKYRALDRMYLMLFLVLGLATLLIGLDAWYGLM